MNDLLEKSNPSQVEYFKEIVATIREPLLVLDAGLHVLAANRSFYKFFKVKPAETIGQPVYELGNRQWDIPGLRLLLETLLPQKVLFNDYKVEHDFPVIGRRSLLLNARRISRPPKQTHWILLAFEDVTERMEMDRKLQASEQRFRRAFETAQDGMLLVEKNAGMIVNSNQSAEQLLGYSKRSLQKMNLWQLGILKDEAQFRQTALELEERGMLGLPDMTIPVKRGGHFPADVYLMDKAAVIQCNIRGIDERKRMDAALHALEEYRTIFENAMEGIFQSTPEGRFLTVNPALAGMAGYASPQEMVAAITNIGQQFFVEPARRRECARLMEQQGSVSKFEFQIWRKDGGVVWVSENARAVRDAKGALLYYEGIIEDISERKQVEQALCKSEAMFRAVVENSADGILFSDANSVIQYRSSSYNRINGFSDDERIGHSGFETVHPDDLEHVNAWWARLIANPEMPYKIEYRILHKDGTIRWTESTGKNLLGNPDVQAVIVTTRDITERKRAEELLRESEARFRAVIENSHDGILFGDANAVIHYRSPSYNHINGFSDVERVGHSGFETAHPDDLLDIHRWWEQLITQPEMPLLAEYRIRHKDGTWRWIESTGLNLLENPDVHSVVVTSRDITQRRQAEEALRLSEERYRILMDTVPDGVIVHSQGRIIYANPAGAKIGGAASPQELIGMPVLDFVHPDFRKMVIDRIQLTTAGFPAPMAQEKFIRLDGRVIDVQVTNFQVMYADQPAILTVVTDITEHKQAEQALHDSEEKFRLSFMTSMDAFYIARIADGQLIETNDGFKEIFGYTRQEAIGKTSLELDLFADPQDRVRLLAELKANDRVREMEIKGRRKNGQEITVSVSASLIQIADQTHVLGMMRDITERKQAERLLRDSEERYKLMFESAPLAISITRGTKIIYANPAYLKLFGFSQLEELQDIPPLELFTPEIRPQVLENIQRRAQGLTVPNSYEVECSRKDGTRFPIIMNLTRITFADGPATVGFIIDITERKHAEELLRASEKEFHSLAESMPQIVWVTRPDGSNIYFNQQWVDYTGLTLAESYGNGWNKPFHPDDQQRAWDAWQNATRNGATYSLECRLRRADGEYRWWLIRGVPLLDERGSIIKWFGTCTDIHEMKQAEDQIHQMNAELEQRVQERTRQLQEAQEQLVRREKLAVLGQLAGGVGHELRNPLGVISNSVYYLNLVQPDANEKIKKHHAMIEQEVRNAARIVGDLLDYTRVISTNPQPASVPALVEQTLSRSTLPASILVRRKLPADLPQVYADPLHAQQILGNLVANACQAMPAGGKLTISARLQNGMAAIAVKDTGTGITPENMQKLFEPLFTTKAGGIGLGLAVSQKLAEANGGRIQVHSQPGQGSTFTLYLPVMEGS